MTFLLHMEVVVYTYQIINATNDEREIIDEIIKYIDQNYHEKILPQLSLRKMMTSRK